MRHETAGLENAGLENTALRNPELENAWKSALKAESFKY